MKKYVMFLIFCGLLLLLTDTSVLANSWNEPISYESSMVFRANLFIGEGATIGHGETFEWYTSIFNPWFYGLPISFADMVGLTAWTEWWSQFSYTNDGSPARNIREATKRSFIEDFELTKQDLITNIENSSGMSIQEIEEHIIYLRKTLGEDSQTYLSALSVSLTSIYALFSNDVYAMNQAFPGGYGIVYNGMAFSPEWVLQNIEKAVYEKQLPIEEILRVLGISMRFSALDHATLPVIVFLYETNPSLIENELIHLLELGLFPYSMTLEELIAELEKPSVHAHYHDTIRIRADNNFIPIPADDQQPVLTDGRTLVPLRAVMEYLGFTVDWQESESLVTLTMGANHAIQVQIGNLTMQVNGISVALDVPPHLINGRTMVPVRAIAEATGFAVDWLADERIVDITF